MTLGSPERLLVRSATHAAPWTVTAVLATMAGAVGALLLPAALAAAVDATMAAGPADTGGFAVGGLPVVFTAPVAWLLALLIALAVAEVLAELSVGRAVATGTAWLRQQLLRCVLAPGPAALRRDPGDTISRLVGDAAEAGAAPALAMHLAAAATMSIGAAIGLAVLGWQLLVAFLAGLPLALLLARRFLHQTAGHALRYQQVAGELSGRLVDAAAGLRTIAACGTHEQEVSRVLAPLPGLAGAGRALWRSQAGIAWRAGLVVPAVELAVLLAAGSRLVDGELTVGQLLGAGGYAVLGLAFVQRAGLLMRLSRARACAGRLLEVLAEEPPEEGRHRLPPGPGRLELRAVTVDGVLTDITLMVPAGCAVALVGTSGSGVSELAEVAGGLRPPDRGQVLLDGVPLATLAPEDLADAVGYAFARPVLHGATVGDAIGYGMLVTPELVSAAARTAHIHEALTRLPQGYRTPLTEAPMSGGELQRVGLARAVLRRPRLLVLDDAASSLDTVTEARISATIAAALPRATRLVVTHRASTAARADLVVWLRDGVVADVSPHRALLEVPGYRDVFGAD